MGVARGCTAQEGEEIMMGVGQGHTSQCESFLSRQEGEDGAMGVAVVAAAAFMW